MFLLWRGHSSFYFKEEVSHNESFVSRARPASTGKFKATGVCCKMKINRMTTLKNATFSGIMGRQGEKQSGC